MTITHRLPRLHLLCASVAMLALHSCIPEPAFAAPAPYPIDVNSRAQSAPAVTCYRANSFTIRATYLDGQTASDLTGAIPFLSWATNATAASVSTSSWAFASSPTNGIVDFTFAPEAVNFTPGRYIYEVGVKTSNSVVSVYRQGVFFIVGSPTAAGVGAVNWTTSLNWDLIDWTNLPSYIASESDPVAYPVATNALALASTALQPPATNGMLTASWAETGTVSRATMADMLRSPGGKTWLEVEGGNTYIVEVVASSNAYVVSTSGAGYNGPPAGTVWTAPIYDSGNERWEYTGSSYGTLFLTSGQPSSSGVIGFNLVDVEASWGNEIALMPLTAIPTDYYTGSFVADWVPVTNRYEVAKQEPTLILINGKASHLAATNIAAAAVAGSGHAMAEQVVSGAVGTASAGNRYYWTSATNVVLSVNLTSGQVVNLAKLNNTATNSITAIGPVGWEWTGGDVTNTIAAGKSMTFGFIVDAATGKTNAYATGVSK